MFTDKQIRKALRAALEDADDERQSAEETRKTFGDCGAATVSHWTAYGMEQALEVFMYELTKIDHEFRNGKRDQY